MAFRSTRRGWLHLLPCKSRLCCMHEGPVLTSILSYSLGRVDLAENMLDSACCLGLSRLPRPRSALDLGHACT
eukprot:43895-Chlamydomonas_euryale.AAC.10